jgi:hypothetical protein
MYSAGFEPVISAVERLQTYALDLTATGTGSDEAVMQWLVFVELCEK